MIIIYFTRNKIPERMIPKMIKNKNKLQIYN